MGVVLVKEIVVELMLTFGRGEEGFFERGSGAMALPDVGSGLEDDANGTEGVDRTGGAATGEGAMGENAKRIDVVGFAIEGRLLLVGAMVVEGACRDEVFQMRIPLRSVMNSE